MHNSNTLEISLDTLIPPLTTGKTKLLKRVLYWNIQQMRLVVEEEESWHKPADSKCVGLANEELLLMILWWKLLVLFFRLYSEREKNIEIYWAHRWSLWSLSQHVLPPHFLTARCVLFSFPRSTQTILRARSCRLIKIYISTRRECVIFRMKFS